MRPTLAATTLVTSGRVGQSGGHPGGLGGRPHAAVSDPPGLRRVRVLGGARRGGHHWPAQRTRVAIRHPRDAAAHGAHARPRGARPQRAGRAGGRCDRPRRHPGRARKRRGVRRLPDRHHDAALRRVVDRRRPPVRGALGAATTAPARRDRSARDPRCAVPRDRWPGPRDPPAVRCATATPRHSRAGCTTAPITSTAGRPTWSSQTGACQAGILHGNNHDIPCVPLVGEGAGDARWSPTTRATPQSSSAGSPTGRGLLHADGASRANILSGDAPHSLLTMSTVLDVRRGRLGERLLQLISPIPTTWLARS